MVDPEGDYETLAGAVVVGGREQPPSADQVMQMLDKPDANVVADLVGVPIADRPPFFLALLPRLLELRARAGRPHWLIIDETHHMEPAGWEPALPAQPPPLGGVLRITAPGEVREDAAPGEAVRVVNRTSQKSLVGRVLDASTVAVEF